MDLNVCTFTGRLGKDPEMRYTPQGDPVTNFSMAVGVAKEKALWLRVTVWGRQAESCNQYLSKGNLVGVSGRLSQNEWEGDDGVRRTELGLTANYVQFLTPKGEGGSKEGHARQDSKGPEERNLEQEEDPIVTDDVDYPF